MKVFYYYYYLFYKKILDPDPRLAATLGFTALVGFFLIAVLNIAFAYFFCFDFNKYYMIAVFAIIFLMNTFYFFSSKRVTVIVKAKPMFFNSHRATIITVLIFSLFVISTLFWVGDYANHIRDHCR
jgi:hypothetical protein